MRVQLKNPGDRPTTSKNEQQMQKTESGMRKKLKN